MTRRRVVPAIESRLRLALAALCVVGFATIGCTPKDEGDSSIAWEKLPPLLSPDPELAPLGMRLDSYDKVCGRGRGDPFALALCGGNRPPNIRNMASLLKLANLEDERAFALTANSTSLVAMSVTPLNPRVLVFPRVDSELKPPENMTAVGFVRGEQFVEVVSRDDTTGDLNFYVVAFERGCNYDSQGCDLASLLTDEIERDWTAYSVYDQDDLERTSFDCLSCHQPGGRGTKRILRMQELSGPWLHWFPQRFAQRTDSDRVLLAQFTEAHQGDNQYGGIPVDTIANAIDEGSGAALEALVRAAGFDNQPNPFDSQLVVNETKSGGTSATWQARFGTHLQGQAIAVPYPAIDVTDEAKRSAASRSYRDVVGGVAARETLMDTRQVFSSDAAQKLSFVSQTGADGRTVLLQMCSRCHDGRGNPELSKNHFNVLKLEAMSRAQKDVAIARITAPATSTTRMPPWRVGTLTPDGIAAATAELKK